MFTVGVTGGIGSGKSSATDRFRQLEYPSLMLMLLHGRL